MFNIFKLKYKLHHLINIIFYLIFFVIGFLVGSSKLNFLNFLFIDNVYAYSYGDNIPTNKYYINAYDYIDSSYDEYHNATYGYQNSTDYSVFSSRNDFLEDNHILTYLDQVTDYVTDNYADDYDFIIFLNRYVPRLNSNYYASNWNYDLAANNYIATAIYIYWFPKNSLNEFELFDYWTLHSMFGISPSDDLDQCLASGYCRNDYIPGSGLDVIPISVKNGNSGQNFFMNNLFDSDFNIIEYQNFRPFFTYYKSWLQENYDNPPSWLINSSDLSYKEDYFSTFYGALNDEYFIYPNFNLSFVRPLYIDYSYYNGDNIGWLFYYSSIPLKYKNSNYVFVVGSKAYYYDDYIDTYSVANHISYENYSNDELIDNYFNSLNYRKVCAKSNSVIISTSSSNYNNFNIFMRDNEVFKKEEILYDFYNYDYINNVLTSFDTNLVYLDDNTNFSGLGLPDYLNGYSMFNYQFTSNNSLQIVRTNTNISNNSFNKSIIKSFSNIIKAGVEIGFDTSVGPNEINSSSGFGNGNWCLYIPNDLYVTHLETSSIDDIRYHIEDKFDDSCTSRDISFNGSIITPYGLLDINYKHPICNVDNTIYSYNKDFYNSNKSTFVFLSQISSHFFNNIDRKLFVGFITICVLLVFLKILSYFGGGK